MPTVMKMQPTTVWARITIVWYSIIFICLYPRSLVLTLWIMENITNTGGDIVCLHTLLSRCSVLTVQLSSNILHTFIRLYTQEHYRQMDNTETGRKAAAGKPGVIKINIQKWKFVLNSRKKRIRTLNKSATINTEETNADISSPLTFSYKQFKRKRKPRSRWRWRSWKN